MAQNPRVEESVRLNIHSIEARQVIARRRKVTVLFAAYEGMFNQKLYP
jgi:hypothetical protein